MNNINFRFSQRTIYFFQRTGGLENAALPELDDSGSSSDSDKTTSSDDDDDDDDPTRAIQCTTQ